MDTCADAGGARAVLDAAELRLMEHGYTRASLPAQDAREVTGRVFGDEALVSYASMDDLADAMHYLCSWSASQRFFEATEESIEARFGDRAEALWGEAFGGPDVRALVAWPLFGRVFQRG